MPEPKRKHRRQAANLNRLERVFTTGEVAEICKVCPRTAAGWIDAGLMPGSYRVPAKTKNGGDRRVPIQSLVTFLKGRGMPLNGLEYADASKILLVAVDSRLVEDLQKRLLENTGRFKFQVAHTGFGAGLVLATFKPDVLVIDFCVGAQHATAMLREWAGFFRTTLRGRSPAVLGGAKLAVHAAAVVGEDFTDTLDPLDFQARFQKPVNPDELAEWVASRPPLH